MKHSIFIGLMAVLVGGGLSTGFGQQTQTPLIPKTPSTPRQPEASVGKRQSSMHLASPATRAWITALLGKEYELERDAEKLYAAGDLGGAEKACLASLAAAPAIQQHPNPEVEQLLGRIYLQEGRNREAIPPLKACDPYISQDIQGLDLTIAYARLGDYAQARKHYSDRLLRNHRMSEKPLIAADLPSIADLGGIEANALLERGMDDYMHADYDRALDKLVDAERLAPENAMIAYYISDILYDKGRYSEAIPRLEKVSASPRGSIFAEVQEKLYDARIYIQRQKRAAQKSAQP